MVRRQKTSEVEVLEERERAIATPRDAGWFASRGPASGGTRATAMPYAA